MNPRTLLAAGALAVGSLALGSPLGPALADELQGGVVVRIAELEIDPAQLESYTAAVKEGMRDAVRLEPGVLAIYSVALTESPTSLRFFEIYASEEAYRAHLESPHFKKYVATTQPMIRSRRLIETVPVQLSSKLK